MIYSKKQVDRFWNNVRIGNRDDCWPWQRSINSSGYGQVGLRVDGNTDRILKAHKVAWEIRHNTRLEPGVRAGHTCNNKLCCNPHHVVIIGGPGCASALLPHVRGENHGRSKLTERQARIIRYKLNELTTREVADAFAVAYHTIWDIRKGITWRHI